MLTKIKGYLNSDLVKVSVWNALSTFVKMLANLVSIKIIAQLIGPTGVALMGQLANFTTIVLTIGTGGITNGVIKFIAQSNDDEATYKPYIRTAVWITLLFSFITGVLLIFCASFLTKWILHSTEYCIVFILFGVTITLYSINMLTISILNGFKEFRKLVFVNMAISVSSLLFSVTLVYIAGVTGALIALVTSQSVVVLVTLFLIWKSSWFTRSNLFGKFDMRIAKQLLHYSLMAFVTAATFPLSQMFIRNLIIQSFSIVDAGIWEGMNRVSSMYLLIITTSLSVYYLPRLSEIQSKNELVLEVKKVYKLVVPVLLLILISVFVLRDFIIGLIFSPNFNPMRDLFLLQLIGDFFKILSWIIAFNMLAKSMTKTYIITEIVFSVIYCFLTAILLPIMGVKGAIIAYGLNYLLYFLLMVVGFRFYNK